MKQDIPTHANVLAGFRDTGQDTSFDFSQSGRLQVIPQVAASDSIRPAANSLSKSERILRKESQSLAGHETAFMSHTVFEQKAVFDTVLSPIEKVGTAEKADKTQATSRNVTGHGSPLFDLAIGLMLLLGFAYVRFRYHDHIRLIVRSFFSNRAALRLLREFSILTNPSALLYSILSVGSVSWFVVIANDWLRPFPGFLDARHWYLWLEVSMIILCVMTAKFMLIRFTSWLLMLDRPLTHYVLLHLLFLQIYGTLLFFLSIVLVWGRIFDAKSVVWIGFCVGVILFLLMLIRAFVTGRFHYRIASSYIIMYLCTLEILPLVVLYELLICELV